MASPRISAQTSSILVKFEHGQLKRGQEHLVSFTYQPEKKRLKAQTKWMKYTGQSTGRKNLTKRATLAAVVDKATGETFLIDTDVIHMRPDFGQESETKQDSAVMSYSEKLDRVTMSFGSKKKLRAMETRQRNKLDSGVLERAMSSAVACADLGASPQLPESGGGGESSALPPHNKEATRPEDVYDMENIAPAGQVSLLRPDTGELASADKQTRAEWAQTAKYPEVVLSRLSSLPLNTEACTEQAAKLLYLSSLIKMLGAKVSDLRKKDGVVGVPRTIWPFLLERYTVLLQGPSGQRPLRTMPNRKKDRLLCDILVLCLTLNDYSLPVEALHNDIKVGHKRLQQVIRSLGCIIKSSKIKGLDGSTTQMSVATLTAPPTFPNFEKRKSKGNR